MLLAHLGLAGTALYPVGCVAIANDNHNTLAMVKRRDDESIAELLLRLDAAIHNTLEHDFFTDEINAPAPLTA